MNSTGTIGEPFSHIWVFVIVLEEKENGGVTNLKSRVTEKVKELTAIDILPEVIKVWIDWYCQVETDGVPLNIPNIQLDTIIDLATLPNRRK